MKRLAFFVILGAVIGSLVGCDMQTTRAVVDGAVQGATGGAGGGWAGMLIGAIGGALTGGGAAWAGRDSKRDRVLGQFVQAIGGYLNEAPPEEQRKLLDNLSMRLDGSAKKLVKKLKMKLGVE